MQAVDESSLSGIQIVLEEVPYTGPVAAPDSYVVPAGDSLIVFQPGVLANDTGPEDGIFGSFRVSGPENGTLELDLLGGFSYTPDIGFAGTDSFVYQAFDGASFSAPATVEITVERIEITGTDRSDRLCGTENAEIFRAGSGRLDQIWLGGGMDVVAFGEETANDRIDITRIFDYGADDVIDLGGATVIGHEKQAKWLVLTLDGDGDMIRIRGVEFEDLVFA